MPSDSAPASPSLSPGDLPLARDALLPDTLKVASPPGPVSNVRWLIFALACGTSFLLYLHRYTWGAMKYQIADEFKLTPEQLGLLDGAFNFTYAGGQIPGGMLGDWFGAHFVLTIMIFLWSLSMGTMVFSKTFYHLMASRLLFGLAQAGCYPNVGKATKSWFPPSARTTVQGFITSSGRVGGAASFFIIGTVMLGYWKLDWQAAMQIFTGAGVVFAVLFFVLFRNTPREHPLANSAEAELISGLDPPAAVGDRAVLNWGQALRSRNLRAMIVQQFASAYVDNVFQVWIIFYLQQQKHLKITSAGWMGALPLLGGACGGIFGGTLQSFLLKRTGNRRWTRSLVGMTGSSMAALCMVVSTQFDSAAMFIATLVVLKFFADWAQPTIWATVTDIGGRSSASVFAIINTSGSLAGVLAGPLMGGMIQWFSDKPALPGERIVPTASGWNALFFSLAAIYLTAALCWLFIDCTKPIDPEKVVPETSP